MKKLPRFGRELSPASGVHAFDEELLQGASSTAIQWLLLLSKQCLKVLGIANYMEGPLREQV